MRLKKLISLATAFSAVTLLACAPASAPGPAMAPSEAGASAKPANAAAPSAVATAVPATTSSATSAPAEPASTTGLTGAEEAEAAAFFDGKTVRVLVGFAAGGGYDIFARTTAKHLSRYIPGSPTVVVENMPGAASLTLANHVFNVAPKDGTVMGTFDPALVLTQAVGGGGGAIQFDPKTFSWLGSPTSSTNQCLVRVDSGADTLDKLISSPKAIIFGATALGNSTSVLPTLVQHDLGANLKVVTGYDGVNSIKLAVERGEAEGMCGTWQSFRSTHAEWLTGNPPFARVAMKGMPDPENELQDVPNLRDALKSEEARQILDMAMAPQAAGFVYAAPPDVPAVRLRALRSAMVQAWNDPEFRADAQKAKLAPIPQDHQVVEQLFSQILSAPTDRLKRTKEVLGIQ